MDCKHQMQSHHIISCTHSVHIGGLIYGVDRERKEKMLGIRTSQSVRRAFGPLSKCPPRTCSQLHVSMFHTFIAWCASSLSNVVALSTLRPIRTRKNLNYIIGDPEAWLAPHKQRRPKHSRTSQLWHLAVCKRSVTVRPVASWEPTKAVWWTQSTDIVVTLADKHVKITLLVTPSPLTWLTYNHVGFKSHTGVCAAYPFWRIAKQT